MRKLLTFGAALALTAMIAGQASAAELAVNGSLGVQLGTLGGPTLTGSGVGTSDGPFTAATIPAGLVTLTGTVSVAITPPALGLNKITVMGPVANEAGTVPGEAGNNGVSNLFFTSGAPAGSVPLDPIGGGGTAMAIVAGLPVTVVGAVWTNLGASAGDPTKTTMIMQVAAGIPVTLTATARDERTAGGEGTVQLLAPALAKIFGGNLGNLPVVGVLTLEFGAPEPGTLFLGGAVFVALLGLARRAR